jgi:DNA-binding GntR family transcriptional regulator
MHDGITAEIRAMIVRHELAPGSRVGEAELSQTLGVSRTPLREALKALAAERLIVLHPFRGATVSELPAEQVSHLFEAQALMESQAAQLACIRARDAEIAAFRSQHERMLRFFRNGNRKSYFAVNQELHRALVAMAHNPILVEAHASIMVQIERARFAALDHAHRWEESIAQHEAIFEALQARDAAGLAEIVRRHVIETGEIVRSALPSAGTARPRGRARRPAAGTNTWSPPDPDAGDPASASGLETEPFGPPPLGS